MSKLNQYDYDRDDFYYDDNDDMGEDESYEETELNEVLEEDNEEQLEKSRRNPEAEKNMLFEKVKSALVWILLILNTMINSLDFTNSKDCFYSYGLY